MSYRKIQPSSAENRASARNRSRDNSEPSASKLSLEAARARGATADEEDTQGNSSTINDADNQYNAVAGAARENQSRSGGNSSKRRRKPESVTPNACQNCKKARSKCDGNTPCRRCQSRTGSLPCVYDPLVKQAKEELARQSIALKAENEKLLKESHMKQRILDALAAHEQVPRILELLSDGESYENIARWLGPDPWEIMSPATSQNSTHDAVDQEMGGVSTNFNWTSVTSDLFLLDHLFQLYFAWVNPVHMILTEQHFATSYKDKSPLFCSSVLVNAICAMACHLPQSGEMRFEQLGASFSEEVRASIDAEDITITTIQAFAIMYLVDCARGKCLRASTSLRIAAVHLPKIDVVADEAFPEVLNNTIRAIRCLNIEWAQATFSTPAAIDQHPQESSLDHSTGLDGANWYFYNSMDNHSPPWPGLFETTNIQKAKLVDIIESSVMMFYNPYCRRIQAHQILQLYERYQEWRHNLPEAIGKVEDSSEALPHVLSLFMLYSTSVIQLLRPLMDFEDFPIGNIQRLVWVHAQEGLQILNVNYRTKYTCRYQPVLQMFGTLHVCDIIARFFPDLPAATDPPGYNGAGAVAAVFETLMQSRAGFPIAGPLQELLKRSAEDCAIPLPGNVEDLMNPPRGPRPNYNLSDFIEACTRPTYHQPATQIQAKYADSFRKDWRTQAGTLSAIISETRDARGRAANSEEERGAHNLMHISNLVNQS